MGKLRLSRVASTAWVIRLLISALSQTLTHILREFHRRMADSATLDEREFSVEILANKAGEYDLCMWRPLIQSNQFDINYYTKKLSFPNLGATGSTNS